MNTLPAKTEPVGLFTPAQIDLIKRDICKGASDDELKKFLWECERTRLDPFARQIYSIQRREKYLDNGQWRWRATRSTQVSIDGLRLLAQRSGEYAGQLGPEWCSAAADWRDVWLDDKPPMAARVAALRKDFEKPLWAVAVLNDYAPRNDKGELVAMWRKMPALMLAKCAEALALRRAFPQELSGLYSSDEMAQADTAHAGRPVSPALSIAEEMQDEIPDHELHAGPSAAIQPASTAAAGDKETSPPAASAAALSLEEMAREAAIRGRDTLVEFYSARTAKEKTQLKKKFGEDLRELVKLYPVNQFGSNREDEP